MRELFFFWSAEAEDGDSSGSLRNTLREAKKTMSWSKGLEPE